MLDLSIKLCHENQISAAALFNLAYWLSAIQRNAFLSVAYSIENNSIVEIQMCLVCSDRKSSFNCLFSFFFYYYYYFFVVVVVVVSLCVCV